VGRPELDSGGGDGVGVTLLLAGTTDPLSFSSSGGEDRDGPSLLAGTSTLSCTWFALADSNLSDVNSVGN
jgi:hypothetical protein